MRRHLAVVQRTIRGLPFPVRTTPAPELPGYARELVTLPVPPSRGPGEAPRPRADALSALPSS